LDDGPQPEIFCDISNLQKPSAEVQTFRPGFCVEPASSVFLPAYLPGYIFHGISIYRKLSSICAQRACILVIFFKRDKPALYSVYKKYTYY